MGNKFALCSENIYKSGLLTFDTFTDSVALGGIKLPLSEKQHDVLWLLAHREDMYMTFEVLYENVWFIVYDPEVFENLGDDRPQVGHDVALNELTNLMVTVNEVGKGRVWIEYEPDKGYVLRQEQCTYA